MKTIKKTFILLLLTGLAISCAKSSSNPTTPATPVTQSLTAVIGGNAWIATTLKTTTTSGYFSITGTAADGTILKLTMPQNIAVGTTNLGAGTQNTVAYQSTATTNNAYTGTGGTLNITSNANNVVKGNYSNLDLENGNNSVPTIYGTSGTFVAQF